VTPVARLAPVLAIALAGLLALGARADDRAPQPRAPRPPDVLLFVGDGMGPVHVTLGRLVKGAPLAMDTVSMTGLCRTDSLTGPVTDSAAAITAIACGVKTKNKTLGVDGEGAPVRSVAEDLADRGYRIGIVTTTRVTHATPAGLYGHSAAREDEALLARQLAESRVDVCVGGGRRVFDDATLALFRGGPGRRVLAEDMSAFAKEFAALSGYGPRWPPSPPRPRCLALLAPGHLPFEIDRAPGAPSLSEMTTAALELLSRDDLARPPLFLMVEGGRIDHACHGHDAATTARDVIAFDDAVALGLAFARERGALMIVTADHATGGLAISEKVDLPGLRRVRASAQAMLEEAGGDATKLRAVVAEKAGLGLSLEEATLCVTAKHRYSNNGALAHLLSRRLGVHFAWTPDEQEEFHSTEGHDATLVPVFAEGPGAARFGGVIDNTDIAKGIRAIAAEVTVRPRARKSSPAQEF